MKRMYDDKEILSVCKLTPDANNQGSMVLNDGLEVIHDGDVIVGKDLFIDGELKLNGVSLSSQQLTDLLSLLPQDNEI